MGAIVGHSARIAIYYIHVVCAVHRCNEIVCAIVRVHWQSGGPQL